VAVVYNRISHPVGIAAFALFPPGTRILRLFLFFITANIFYGINIFLSFFWRGGEQSQGGRVLFWVNVSLIENIKTSFIIGRDGKNEGNVIGVG